MDICVVFMWQCMHGSLMLVNIVFVCVHDLSPSAYSSDFFYTL